MKPLAPEVLAFPLLAELDRHRRQSALAPRRAGRQSYLNYIGKLSQDKIMITIQYGPS